MRSDFGCIAERGGHKDEGSTVIQVQMPTQDHLWPPSDTPKRGQRQKLCDACLRILPLTQQPLMTAFGNIAERADKVVIL
jgi:hypothetical protein